MIQTEMLNEGTLIKHYSDSGYMLLQVETGLLYSDPVDVFPCVYTYQETDQLIEDDNEDNVEEEIPGDEDFNTDEEASDQLV